MENEKKEKSTECNHNCPYYEFKTNDYKYNMHVSGGFYGCSLLRKAVRFIDEQQCPKSNSK